MVAPFFEAPHGLKNAPRWCICTTCTTSHCPRVQGAFCLALTQRGLESSDPRVAAVARHVRAESALNAEVPDDEANWSSDLRFAIEHGDARVASRAALLLGDEVPTSREAYKLFEMALRSPLPDTAHDAAESLAELFDHEPDIARGYRRRAQELAEQTEQ